jgi:hypothetical protein
MDIKRKTYDILTWKKTFISRHILHQHWYTCPITLPVRRNPQHRSLSTVVLAISAPGRIICDFRTSLREFLDPVVNRRTRQTLPTVNRKHFFMNFLCIETFCQQKTHYWLLVFGNILKQSRHFDYWNEPLNMRMLVCYLEFLIVKKIVNTKLA